MTQSPPARTVLFDHDGGVDDLLSLLMLLAMPHIDLAGIVVTPADCFLRPAVSASLKTLRFFNRLDIELSEGALHGVNPFPRAWRAHAYAIDALPILNEIKPTEKGQPPIDNDEAARKSLDFIGPEPNLFGGVTGLGRQGSFEDLKKRIQARLVAELGSVSDVLSTGEVRQKLETLYEQVLSRENIILSRTERSRLFESIAVEALNKSAGALPTPAVEPGHEFLARKLQEADNPVTVLITGPVSNLAAALEAEPDLSSKIEEVVWMGGALNVAGNVHDHEHDGSAEWNAYWDPPATYSLWHASGDVPITLFSLDATNHVPVTMEFLHRLAQQRRYPLSDLAGQCWALTVGAIPAYHYTYFMWDTLTTGYLGAPQYITFRQARTEVVPNGPSAGRIKEVSEGGKVIRVADTVDVEAFQNYLLELFRY